jgi:hypothetical protein
VKGDHVPDLDHVSRFCRPATIDEGIVTGLAFRLREGEEYLSVNWLESLAHGGRSTQIAALRNVFERKFSKVSATARFAVLSVGELCAYIRNEGRDLTAIHEPEPDDQSHCGVYGLRFDDEVIADMLAEIVQETVPARAD